jgi:CubicO group peptidase (beta-lactamase class C family)
MMRRQFMRRQWMRRGAAALAAALLARRAAWAADSRGLQLLNAWLAAFNGDDPAQMQAFDERYQPPRPLAQMRDFRRQTGGFTLVRVERDEPGLIQALLREKAADTVARIEMRLQEQDPPRMLGARLQPVSEPEALGLPRLPDSELVAAARAHIDAEAAAGRYAGTVLVARGEQVLLEGAWGLADRERGLPMRVDSQLRIGSMNKMFTAVATLQFVQAGRLALDDRLGAVLGAPASDWPLATVSIRQLLSHRGGTGDIFGPEFETRRNALRSHDDYLRQFGPRPLGFEPGTQMRYSNFGFVLLGAVIEKLSGRPYGEHLRSAVFAPAGMSLTGSLPESAAVPGRTRGYRRVGERWVDNEDTLPWSGTAAGGGYSSVGDLLRFAQALKAGRLLSPALLDEATGGRGGGYGYGFGTWGSGDTRGYGHNGGAPGMNGELRIWPVSGAVVAVLSNLDPPSATRVADYLTARLR